jgi:hypothetical protein
MKFNTRQVLVNPLDGKPLLSARNKPMTMGEAAVAVLVTGEDKTADLSERGRRFVLGCKLANTLEAVDPVAEISADDVTLLKDLVDKRWPNDLVAAQFAILIDPPEGFEPVASPSVHEVAEANGAPAVLN